MQLPGMSTDPVRVSLDVTFDPVSNTFGISERQWRWYEPTTEWRLEALYTNGTPLSHHDAAARFLELARNCANAVKVLAPPFTDEPFT